MKCVIIGIILFMIAAIMTMTGRGGGNFYALVPDAAGRAMHQAAISS